MIDIDPASTCRICLEDGAIYPIFESTEEIEGVYAKLASCIREKIENIEGYPRNICLKCKNTSDTICSFLSQFEETCRILKKKIVQVKTEQQDSIDLSDNDFDNNDDDYQEPLAYELEIDKSPIKPKPEKRDPTELLESLKHLTVKKIKVENESGETSSVVKKRGRPRKQPMATTKPAKITKVPKPAAEKKPAVKPTIDKKEKKAPPPETKIIKDVVAEKALREKGSDIDKKYLKTTNTTALCDTCGEVCNSKDELIRHIRKTHAKNTFKCPKCPKAYPTKRQLNYHEKCHGGRNHICETCGKAFVHKKDVNSHVRYVHQKVRPAKVKHKCKYCNRSFVSKRCVLIHERSVHTGERPEVCRICDGRFYDIVYLKEHMRIHTGQTPFKCPVCDRGYTQLGNMKSHMRNHKISQQPPQILSKIKPNYLKFMRP